MLLTTFVDLDVTSGDGPTREREVRVGDIFPIVLYVQNGDSADEAPVEFDTLILEVFFNDEDNAIVLVEPTDRPVAGDLAHVQGATLDAFSLHPIEGSTDDPVPLTLFGFASAEPAGPYKGRTGRAGLTSANGPFSLAPHSAPVSVAMGKSRAGLLGDAPGTSRLIAHGMALRNGESIPVKAESSLLRVVP